MDQLNPDHVGEDAEQQQVDEQVDLVEQGNALLRRLTQLREKRQHNIQRFRRMVQQREQVMMQLEIERVRRIVQQRRRTQQPVTGLTPERIGRFEHFAADGSLVGEQCVVCLDDLKCGTRMVRLDCHVSHCFCKTCTDAWFKDHNKCPLCNHVFN